MGRAFASTASTSTRATVKRRHQNQAPRASHSRPSSHGLGERLYAALCKHPGEIMAVLASADRWIAA
jgi:hypothetical protein